MRAMPAFHIIVKDLRLLLRDGRTASLLLATPLIFITILGLTMGGLIESASRGVWLLEVENGSGGAVAEALVTELEAVDEFRIVRSEILDRTSVSDQTTPVGTIRIGPEFVNRISELEIADIIDVRRGQLADGVAALDISVQLTVEIDESGQSPILNLAQGIPPARVSRYIIEQTVFGVALRTLVPQVARTDPFMERYLDAWEAENPLPRTDSDSNASPAPDGPDVATQAVYSRLVPGYTVCFVFFLIIFMGRSLLAERDLGTLDRLRAARVGRMAILLGKTIPFFMVSLFQMIVLFVAGHLILGMSYGSLPVMLLPLMASTALAATGLGLVIGALGRTDGQITAYGILIALTAAAVSGCFLPRVWMPDSLQQLSLATPHAWALVGYAELLQESAPDVALVWQCCLVLVTFSAVFLGVGCWRLTALFSRD